jgi:hypothetical protein
MTITKSVTKLRKGDHIVLRRTIRTGRTERTSAEVLRLVNTPYGLVIQCSYGIYIHANRQDSIQVIP